MFLLCITGILFFVSLQASNLTLPESSTDSLQTAFVFSSINSIDLGTPDAYPHRHQGFDNQDLVSGGYSTAKERVTRLRFWCSQPNNSIVTIRCRHPEKSRNSVPIIASINGKKIGESILSEEWQNITFDLPRKRLRPMPESNILTLETPKGTETPEIHFDVAKIQFSSRSQTTFTRPYHQSSPTGQWKLSAGESLIFYLFTSPGDTIEVTGISNGTGLLQINTASDHAQKESAWLGALGKFQKKTTMLTTEESDTGTSESHCTRVSVHNMDSWWRSDYQVCLTCNVKQINSRSSVSEQGVAGIPSSPNIVLITMDSLRADAVGAYGEPSGTTPTLDRLARQGMQHEPSVAAAPYTTSSVASLMTGVDPHIHKVFNIGDALPFSVSTMAERLKSAGYQTVGINAMPSINGRYGFNRGFDEYMNLFETSPNKDALVHGDHVVRATCEMLDSIAKQSSFFMYIHMREPHLPYLPPEPFIDLFSNGEEWTHLMDDATVHAMTVNEYPPSSQELLGLKNLYRSGLRYADSCLKTVIQHIQLAGYRDNTLIIILSDHGEAFFEHQHFFHNNTVYDEMVSIPVIYTGFVSTEGNRKKILARTTTHQIFELIIGAAGLDPSGQPLLPDYQRPFFQQSHGIGFQGPIAFYRAGLKFIGQDRLPDKAQLYHLDQDPGERLNLIESSAILREWYQNFIDDRSQPHPFNEARTEMTESEVQQLQALGYLHN